MTHKYTAADFVNARFAEHPDGRTAARFGYPSTRPWESSNSSHSDSTMAERGWVPVPTKPTITRSEVRNQIKTQGDEWANGYYTALTDFGGGVIEDPEPTNTDRLKTVLREAWDGHQSMNDVAEWLDKNGVTAPKENN